jgi:hypothetical protein
MPDFGSLLPFNRLDQWKPGCWCVAMIPLCEAHRAGDGRGDLQYPEQWTYFLWAPRDDARPFALPVGWGVTEEPPYAEIFSEVGRQAILFLEDSDIDFVASLEWLLIVDEPPDWLRRIISSRLEEVKVARAATLRSMLGQGRQRGFAGFLQRVIAGAGNR